MSRTKKRARKLSRGPAHFDMETGDFRLSSSEIKELRGSGDRRKKYKEILDRARKKKDFIHYPNEFPEAYRDRYHDRMHKDKK